MPDLIGLTALQKLWISEIMWQAYLDNPERTYE